MAVLPEEEIGRLLLAAGHRLAVAESCTGGFIAHRLTNVPGSSRYFDRGLVTYSERSKQEELQVPAELLRERGAVSLEVAQAMAAGVRRAAGVEVALATTGLAGPEGDERGHPVGLVYVAISGPGGEEVYALHLENRGRVYLKALAAYYALCLLQNYLEAYSKDEKGRNRVEG
ncbi:MAG: CinA family protein [Bacillota bacterium]|nr:CinA family protein [Bacillota bacterium]